MNGKATVKAYEGNVVVPSKNNPEYGSIRLESTVRTTDSNGFLRPQTRSAFLNGTVADLKAMGWVDGQSVDAYIVVEESFDAPVADNPDFGLKIAGDTGIPCTFEGQPIYRTSRVSFTPCEDTLIAHDNSDAIKAKQAEMDENSLTEG